MSRRDEAIRRDREAARDQDERPNEPPIAFDRDPASWASRCSGNRTGEHMRPTRTPTLWRCGSCGQWLRPPRSVTCG